jgi:hypothetical protein
MHNHSTGWLVGARGNLVRRCERRGVGAKETTWRRWLSMPRAAGCGAHVSLGLLLLALFSSCHFECGNQSLSTEEKHHVSVSNITGGSCLTTSASTQVGVLYNTCMVSRSHSFIDPSLEGRT